MSGPSPTYSLAERDRRWSLARELMASAEVDGLVVHGEHEMVQPDSYGHDVYFTNDRPGTIVVFARDADPVVLVGTPMTIADHIEARRRGDEVWIAPEQMRVARHPQGVVDVLREHGLEGASIGVVGLDSSPPWHSLPTTPHTLMSALTERLPRANFKPVYRTFLLLARTQSDEELAVVAHSAKIGDAMARAMLDAAKPGVTDANIYSAGMTEAFRHGATTPPMILQSRAGTVSWEQPPWAHRPQGHRTIENGDIILTKTICFLGMKETQHQVAIAVGDVHADARWAAEVARCSYDAGLAALRPGQTLEDVVDAMKQPLDQAGGWNVHPLIHSINPYGPVCGIGAGLAAHPQARPYRLLAEIPTIGTDLPLAAGMTLSVEPSCVIGDHCVNIGGTVVVGDDAPIELTPFTAQLLHA